MDENGFEVAGLRRSRICVRPQRKPEKKAADMMRMKPNTENLTSPATIIITPAVMVAMMAMRRHEGVSRRKRKANNRTKAREEDLHIAALAVSGIGGRAKGRRTVKRKGDEFERHVPQANI